ncbi:MAG: MFS transporter [Kaiparowitsia implicata GSE-PSE-MK54-09C]|nr:MFS transporter [Kaiparowitsia implicata GSE-PSE-MK54-09C]
MQVFRYLDQTTRSNLIVLFAAGLLFWAAIASILPTLPVYVESTGANSQTIGWVMGMFAVGLLASRAHLARLADSRGRKIVMLIGMVAVATAPLGYVLTTSIPLLMLLRAFHGISIAAFALAYSALVIDLSPAEFRGELIGYMSLVNPVGMGLGPAIGGFVLQEAGFAPAFWVAAIAGFVGLGFTLNVREPPIPKAETQGQSLLDFWVTLVRPHIRTPALVLFMIGLSFGALTTFVPLLVREAGLTLNVGLFYSTAAIAGFGIRLIAGRASDRIGRGPFITLSLVLYMLSMVALWRATTPMDFMLAGFIEGGAAGILIPMMAVLMADRSLPHERGKTFSLCMVGFDLGIALAGPILGAIALYTSYRALFGICALLCLIALGIFLSLSGKNLLGSVRFALGRGEDAYAVEPTSSIG